MESNSTTTEAQQPKPYTREDLEQIGIRYQRLMTAPTKGWFVCVPLMDDKAKIVGISLEPVKRWKMTRSPRLPVVKDRELDTYWPVMKRPDGVYTLPHGLLLDDEQAVINHWLSIHSHHLYFQGIRDGVVRTYYGPHVPRLNGLDVKYDIEGVQTLAPV